MTVTSTRASSAHPSSSALTRNGTFDPALWLDALTEIGGGYALMADRKLALMVADCEADDLSAVMLQIVGDQARQEAVKDAIERFQAGEA